MPHLRAEALVYLQPYGNRQGKQLVVAITDDTSHKPRLPDDEEEGKGWYPTWGRREPLKSHGGDLPRAVAIGGNPNRSAGRPESL